MPASGSILGSSGCSMEGVGSWVRPKPRQAMMFSSESELPQRQRDFQTCRIRWVIPQEGLGSSNFRISCPSTGLATNSSAENRRPHASCWSVSGGHCASQRDRTCSPLAQGLLMERGALPFLGYPAPAGVLGPLTPCTPGGANIPGLQLSPQTDTVVEDGD